MHIVFQAMFVFHLFTQGDPGEYSVSPVSLESFLKETSINYYSIRNITNPKKNILPVFHWDH